MRKSFKVILIIVITIILTYSLAWFVILFSLVNSINKKYSNQNIDIQTLNNSEPYFIKFSKVQFYGFPFKLALSVVNWSEESPTRRIEFNNPINIGYDLWQQQFFINFSGEAIGRFKPIERGFGVKYKNQNSTFSIKVPLSMKLLKIFQQKRDLFEIANLIKNFKFKAGRVEIFDLIDKQKLYDEDYSIFDLTFEKSKYYQNIQDFLDHIPQNIKVTYKTEIIESNIENRIIPAGLLLYRFAWPSSFKFSGDFYIRTKVANFKDLASDWELELSNAKIASNTFESIINVLYKGKLTNNDNNVALKINSQIKVEQGFILKLLKAIKNYSNKQIYLLRLVNNNATNILGDELDFIINNQDKFDLTRLENKQYIFNLDTNLVTQSNQITRAQINNLSLFSNNTGIYLTNEIVLNILKNSYSNGVIIIHNYLKLIDILSPYIYNLGDFKTFSEESREIYGNALKSFLKTISDYPNSVSSDISFDYKIDLANLNKVKIGVINDINKIIPLYYLSLYKAAIEKVKVGEDVKKRMQELIPDFNKYQGALDSLMNPQFQQINENLWQEIIK